MDLELRGKRAIVTGGSRGIGKAIARALAAEGCAVAICARTRDALEAAARELGKETGSKVIPVVADTGTGDSVRRMVDAVVAGLGGVDILVNNAARPGGQGPVPNLEQITDDAFNEDMNVKVLGYLRCAQAVAPHMARQRWGRIVNISGLAARNAGSTIGSMRNVAIVAMAKNLAAELGSQGINVTVVHPGLTRTEATAGVIQRRAQAEGVSPEEIERRMSQGNLVRRIIDASDIANVVAFLASPKSVAINGDVIAAGGGVGTAIYY
jgi:NAD(P)-dependent dehydrogenase (short-subunit alcohol dehydrogenase family)